MSVKTCVQLNARALACTYKDLGWTTSETSFVVCKAYYIQVLKVCGVKYVTTSVCNWLLETTH